MLKRQEKQRAKQPPAKKPRIKTPPKYPFTRARSIQIYPTASQKVLLRAAFDACRHVYNKTVEAINSRASKSKRKDLRAKIVNQAVWDQTHMDQAWKIVDYELRDGAMLDAFKAAKSTRESMAANNKEGKKWKFKGRRKKDSVESIAVRARRLNNSDMPFYSNLFGRASARLRQGWPIMASAKPLPDVFESDVRIWHHKILDMYTIIISEEAPVVVPDTQGPARGACISIDPGVRTFATCYDPQGLICKWGCAGPDGKPSANTILWRLANTANSLRVRMQKPDLRTNQTGRGKRHRRRRHMRKAAARIERRLRSMVDELHHKLALWLCKNYETVLLPSFNVSQMVKKARGRRIGRKTTKQLYSLAHCRFRYYLRYLAQRYDTLVCECSEAFTTQTCGSCGRLSRVGGSETFRCTHSDCGARFDRDENAARNIMLKFVKDNRIDASSTSRDVLMLSPRM
jgi:putative transposase